MLYNVIIITMYPWFYNNYRCNMYNDNATKKKKEEKRIELNGINVSVSHWN